MTLLAGLSYTQVSTWFVNARKRVWKPLMHENADHDELTGAATLRRSTDTEPDANSDLDASTTTWLEFPLAPHVISPYCPTMHQPLEEQHQLFCAPRVAETDDYYCQEPWPEFCFDAPEDQLAGCEIPDFMTGL